MDVIESEDNPPHYHIDNDHIEYHTRSEDGISDYPFLTHIDQGLGDNMDFTNLWIAFAIVFIVLPAIGSWAIHQDWR